MTRGASISSKFYCLNYYPEVDVNYMFVEGTSLSTHIRFRFPLHPSLSAVDGASIEGEGELQRPPARDGAIRRRQKWRFEQRNLLVGCRDFHSCPEGDSCGFHADWIK
jgi:hypothetical protein